MKKEDSKQDLLVSGSLFLPFLPKKAFQKLKIWSFKNELRLSKAQFPMRLELISTPKAKVTLALESPLFLGVN